MEARCQVAMHLRTMGIREGYVQCRLTRNPIRTWAECALFKSMRKVTRLEGSATPTTPEEYIGGQCPVEIDASEEYVGGKCAEFPDAQEEYPGGLCPYDPDSGQTPGMC
jgi:hypothetical protein